MFISDQIISANEWLGSSQAKGTISWLYPYNCLPRDEPRDVICELSTKAERKGKLIVITSK